MHRYPIISKHTEKNTVLSVQQTNNTLQLLTVKCLMFAPTFDMSLSFSMLPCPSNWSTALALQMSQRRLQPSECPVSGTDPSYTPAGCLFVVQCVHAVYVVEESSDAHCRVLQISSAFIFVSIALQSPTPRWDYNPARSCCRIMRVRLPSPCSEVHLKTSVRATDCSVSTDKNDCLRSAMLLSQKRTASSICCIHCSLSIYIGVGGDVLLSTLNGSGCMISPTILFIPLSPCCWLPFSRFYLPWYHRQLPFSSLRHYQESVCWFILYAVWRMVWQVT